MLGRKFCRMNTDNDQFVGEMFAEAAQLCRIMKTIYSTKCPEFEEDYLPPQFLYGEWARSIEPFQVGGEFRGMDKSAILHAKPR